MSDLTAEKVYRLKYTFERGLYRERDILGVPADQQIGLTDEVILASILSDGSGAISIVWTWTDLTPGQLAGSIGILLKQVSEHEEVKPEVREIFEEAFGKMQALSEETKHDA